MDSVSDFSRGLRVRLYRPTGGTVPPVVCLHGGGWTIGSVETHDRACRRLADGLGCAVISVDYRLAADHPWPASVDAAVAVLRRASEVGGADLAR